MDSAWVGIVGGAIGVAGTLIGTIFTQWRGEKQRQEDRRQELRRLELQDTLDREAARRSHWDEVRRDTYRRLVAVSFRWRTTLLELVTRGRVLDEAKANDHLGNDGIRRLQNELSARIEGAELDSFYDAVEDLIVELALTASRGVRTRAIGLHADLGKANRLLRAGDYEGAADLIAVESYAVMLEIMRVELGIEDPKILDEIAATLSQRRSAEPTVDK